ncbi:SIMPL domain-containing protein [Salinigranum rubrum]|uniref:SIMPL domain-containing protein n=1 Tax=Salinigranum rubrum TaxID=755307 RepID=A0A2I8VMJ4_9EURY|nr:SIMPL domain-containing protein [Salinigranum rubrum]AUV83152.1 SIMPL domain-containing protein [Salinigranum rubrum]
MRRSRLTLTLALGLLVVLAGCLGPLQTTPSATDRSTDGTTLSTTGTGSVDAEADLAVVSVAVVATAQSADDARGQVASDVERMRTALREANIPDDAVTTSSFAVYPEYDYSDGERTERGYRAVHSFRIETDPARAGEVVDVAVGNGASEVQGVSFTLSDETRAELRAQAIERAVTAARADADAMAGAAGLSITSIETMSTSGGFAPVERFDVAESAAGGDARTTFEPGPVSVSVTVQVTYRAA